MCMLIHHTPQSKITRAMLADFLKSNPDGFGFMYGDGRKLHVYKLPTPDLKDVIALYDAHIKGREAVMHFRMRTHGDVNEQNTHPYRVTDQLYMAHNGILQTGNSRDKSMSDTWHLIEDHLRPILLDSPNMLYVEAFQDMLGRFIGSGNKLAFCNPKGKIVVINRHSGLTFQNTWFSNTYAWDAVRFGAVEATRKDWKYYSNVYDPVRGPKSGFVSQAYAVNGNTTAAASPVRMTKRQKKQAKAEQRRLDKLAKQRARLANDRQIARGSPRQLVAKAAAEISRGEFKGERFDRSWLRPAFRDGPRAAASDVAAGKYPGPSGPTLGESPASTYEIEQEFRAQLRLLGH